jgi:hypothetical protein
MRFQGAVIRQQGQTLLSLSSSHMLCKIEAWKPKQFAALRQCSVFQSY